MSRVRPFLPNAPIIEGLIDFRVRKRPELDLQSLQSVDAYMAAGYFKKGPIVAVQANLSVSAEGQGSAKTISRELGVRLHSKDEKYVTQVQLEGLTISRLAPYETWEKLLAEAQRMWGLYLAHVQPEQVTRIATRFINNLRLPMQSGERFETYLTAAPQVPAPLPQGVSEFLQRVVIGDSSPDVRANVTQVFQAGPWTSEVPVILDIDVYCTGEFAPAGQEFWQRLQYLRELKNRIFFEYLTERAVELYL